MKKAIFFGIGALTLILASVLYFAQTAASDKNATATGTVVDLENIRGTFYPVVQFISATGDTIVFTSTVGATPPAYDVNEKVAVSYDPTDLTSASVAGFIEQWLIIALLASTGLVLNVIGMFVGKRAPVVLRMNSANPTNAEQIHVSSGSVMSVLFGVGALLFVIAGVVWYFNNSVIDGWIHTSGVVIGYSANTRYNSPIIEYTLNDGTVRKFTSNSSVSGTPYDIGESIEVVYDPLRPHAVKTDEWFDRLFVAMIIGAIGAVAIFIGIVFKFLST